MSEPARALRQYGDGGWYAAPPLKAPWDVRWCCEHDWQPHRHDNGVTSPVDWDCLRCGRPDRAPAAGTGVEAAALDRRAHHAPRARRTPATTRRRCAVIRVDGTCPMGCGRTLYLAGRKSHKAYKRTGKVKPLRVVKRESA